MQITTIVGVVKNGQIELSENIELPENTVVYVVIPSMKIEAKRIMSPHLVNKEDIRHFEKTVEEDL